MVKRDDFDTPNRYMSEAIWFPSYAVIIFFILSFEKNSTVQTLAMIFGLIVTRMILEFVYRIAFGDERLTLRIGILAVIGQLVVWGSLLAFQGFSVT